MFNFKRLLGFIWASPITLAGLVYASLFAAAGWYQKLGVRDAALVYLILGEKCPPWLVKAWARWAGHTIGNVVVMKYNPDDTDHGKITLKHESKHVDQCMRLGIFQPIMYGLCMLAIKIGCPGSDPYYDLPFEIDARRYAGQVVDVVGTLKRIQDQQNRAKNK